MKKNKKITFSKFIRSDGVATLRIIILCFYFIFFLPIFSKAQIKLSVEEAILRGVKTYPALQASQQRLLKNQLNKEHGVSERYPSISLDIGQNNSFTKNNSPTSYIKDFYRDHNVQGVVNANWLLYNGGKVHLKEQQLELLEQQSEADVQVLKLYLTKEIISAYYKVQVEDEKKRIWKETQQLSKERAADVAERKKLGKASSFEVIQAENTLLSDSLSLIQQKLSYQRALYDLFFYVGMQSSSPETAKIILTDKLILQEKKYDWITLRTKIFQNNAELDKLEINTNLARNMLETTTRNSLPSIRYTSSVLQNFTKTKFSELNLPAINGQAFSWLMGGFGINMPIFAGGEIKRLNTEAKIEVRANEFLVNQKRQELDNELQKSLTSYKSQLEIVKLHAKLMENMKNEITFARERFTNGFTTLFEYRGIQLEYIQATVSYIEALYTLKLLETNIEYLTGTLR